MSTKVLNQLFRPTSVAVLGAEDTPGTPGHVVLTNLTSGAFLGPVMPVDPEMRPILGLESYRAVDTLPTTPDLAVICSPPADIPEQVRQLGHRGTKAVVILSRGYFRFNRALADKQREELMAAAAENGVRILGPKCLGFINPSVGLNASLAHRSAQPGRIAFVSQSDSLFTSVLDWAASKNIGFSHCISLGDRYDLHFGNILDFLNQDVHTRAVLLYVETIVSARPFMSAARATARNKPVLVMKAGRSREGAMAAAAHSGDFLGSDDVYDAAFKRAGILRVFDIDTLFDTVETIAHSKPLRGDRLAVLTNGGGPGFLATDLLASGGGRLAELSDETTQALDETLGENWSYWNPLTLSPHAGGELYAAALKLLLNDPGVDGVLVMHVPTAYVDATEVAQAVAKAARKTKRTVLTSWLGADDAAEAREVLAKAGLPTFFTPDKAIRGFLNLVQYKRNQALLSETPRSLPESFEPDGYKARKIADKAVAEGRQILTVPEAQELLESFHISTVPTRKIAFTKTDDPSNKEHILRLSEAAASEAETLGFPVALKVHSPDITRKSLAGGVALNLSSADAVREAAAAMLTRLTQSGTQARLEGFIIQTMVQRPLALELFIEVATDPVFGPVIRFGQGGSIAEIVSDRQTALPPLNMHLAQELVSRTQVSRLFKGYKDHPPVNVDAICEILTKVSQLTIDVPEVFELEINPLYADHEGVIALDAHVSVAAAKGSGADQLAIRPYPRELEECVKLADGRDAMIRPISPEDEPDHWEFLEHVSADDMRFRFFGNIGELPRTEMTKLTQIDYDREMAFIARVEVPEENAVRTVGVVRAMTAPDNSYAEFAILIRSDHKRLGLGRALMDKIIRYCKTRGTERIKGQALLDNKGMATLAERVGFEVWKNMDDDVWDFDLVLNPPEEE